MPISRLSRPEHQAIDGPMQTGIVGGCGAETAVP
jgi:hypothetical protein